MTKSLTQIKNGGSAIVTDLVCSGSVRQRLVDLGVFKGVKINIKGAAPLGDPIIIEINSVEIAIRKNDAKDVLVEECK